MDQKVSQRRAKRVSRLMGMGFRGGPAECAVAVLDYSSYIFCYIIGYIGYIRQKRLKKQARNFRTRPAPLQGRGRRI